MKSYCYILFSTSRNRYYFGSTSGDLPERLRKHNSNHKGYTGGSADWELVYFEEYADKIQAGRREREIKGKKSRTYTQKLISSDGSEHPG